MRELNPESINESRFESTVSQGEASFILGTQWDSFWFCGLHRPLQLQNRGVGVFQHLSLLKSLFLILARVKANKSMAVPPVEQKGTAL